MVTTKKREIQFDSGLKKGNSGPQIVQLNKYLTHFGYLQPKSEVLSFDSSNESAIDEETFGDITEQAVRQYQKFYSLPESGEIDSATHTLMSTPRCGTPDRPLSFTTLDSHWDTRDLSYRFDNFCADLSQEETRKSLEEAFKLWKAVVPLTFREITDGGNADIIIKFAANAHDDNHTFDGMGNVLAHAFSPGKGIGGDVHFDEDEKWSIDLPPSGTDLISVAAHEIGHALGLDHSKVNAALMYAYYSGEHRHLHEDDIQGIKSIYENPTN